MRIITAQFGDISHMTGVVLQLTRICLLYSSNNLMRLVGRIPVLQMDIQRKWIYIKVNNCLTSYS